MLTTLKIKSAQPAEPGAATAHRNARAHPGTLNYGSAGPGSVNHPALQLLKARSGTCVVYMPYQGIATASSIIVPATGSLTLLTPAG